MTIKEMLDMLNDVRERYGEDVGVHVGWYNDSGDLILLPAVALLHTWTTEEVEGPIRIVNTSALVYLVPEMAGSALVGQVQA